MFKDIIKILRETISGQTAWSTVQIVSNYHRLPGYKGQVEAAKETLRLLESYGLSSWIDQHPCDGKTKFWSEVSPNGWQVEKAELWASGDDGIKIKLCDFAEFPLSLMANSASTPERDEPYEVIAIENPEKLESYQDINVKGKVVLVGNCNIDRVVYLAIEQFGADGILTDRMREYPGARTKVDLADSYNWNGFDWQGHDKKTFGFSLTHRQAEWLRKQKTPLVYPKVKTDFQDSQFANVISFIPGTTDEEILIVAHNCHPKPSANDNASGVAAGIEIMRALNHLISNGVFARPKRGIRLLLTPEFTGTYAWLEQNEEKLHKVVAGVNLDMVGEDQSKCHSSLALERPPFIAGTYTALLLDYLLKLISDQASNYFQTSHYPLFRTAKTNFSGGSDHYILSDPSVGIQCAMISQWPDRHYHASSDTVDKVDPAMLARSATIAAGMAWVIANADNEKALQLSQLVYDHFFEELLRLLDREISMDQAKGLLEFILDMKSKDFKRIAALASNIEDLQADQDEKLIAMRKIGRTFILSRGYDSRTEKEIDSELAQKTMKVIPVRKFRGPVPLGLRGYIHTIGFKKLQAWDQFIEDHPSGSKLEYLLLYYADGKRNLYEISQLAELESGFKDLEYTLAYFNLLMDLDLVSYKE